jgi:uncharacterized protein (DUF2336 family)
MIVDRFLQWARTASLARRTQAAGAIARAYLVSPLSPLEREQVEAAITVLLDDSSPDVRFVLAEALAASELAPHHVILTLAADRPPIAALVAEKSPLILDSELVDMVATGDAVIQAAIARRPFLSRAVSAAIAEVGTAQACLALISNGGARAPRFSLDRIIERFGDHPEIRLTLLEREDLPLEVRQVLLGRLTASLRELIVSRDWMAPQRADAVTRQARERAMIAAAFEAPADNMPALVERLIGAGELTPAFLLRAVASGQTLLFDTALAALANVPLTRVRALVASGRRSNLRVLFQQSRLPPKIYPALEAAIDVIRSGDAASDALSDYRRATQLIDAIIARYQRRLDRELDQILALLRTFATDAKRSAARDYAQHLMEAA